MDNKLSLGYVIESHGARMERANRRLFILLAIALLMLFVTNGFWIAYELQMVDEIQIEQEVEAENGNAYVNGIGDFTYGDESKTNDN